MVFSTFIFLFCFLPVFLLVYYQAPRRFRAVWLAVASYVFYGWWRAEYCLLLAGVTALNYYCGIRISRASSPRARHFWVTVSVVCSLGLLGFFKYAGMLTVWADNAARLFVAPADGAEHVVPVLDIVLPIGISFFTFQALSYTVDLYRGHAKPAASLVQFAGYISMFPQLIAGPIVRYQWIADELQERTHTPQKFCLGLHLFIIGLAKKVLLADLFAMAVPAAFGDHQPDFASAWVGVLAYTLQIYFDFSAYSDMAAGLGLLFGFTFPRNFNSPYKSASITEFWRRWHISLSTWLRDYLYLPLGGNRHGARRTYVNLMLVMLLGGLWHGASVIFVLWGFWHGMLLAAERAFDHRHPIKRMPRPLAIACTNLLVIIGWVLFRAEDWPMAVRVLNAMFLPFGGDDAVHALDLVAAALPWLLPVGFAACVFMRNSWEVTWRQSWPQVLLDAGLCLLCVVVVLANQSSPFLYFQF